MAPLAGLCCFQAPRRERGVGLWSPLFPTWIIKVRSYSCFHLNTMHNFKRFNLLDHFQFGEQARRNLFLQLIFSSLPYFTLRLGYLLQLCYDFDLFLSYFAMLLPNYSHILPYLSLIPSKCSRYISEPGLWLALVQ
jgi:hypothetical protein